jgi:hypothetical protein
MRACGTWVQLSLVTANDNSEVRCDKSPTADGYSRCASPPPRPFRYNLQSKSGLGPNCLAVVRRLVGWFILFPHAYGDGDLIVPSCRCLARW